MEERLFTVAEAQGLIKQLKSLIEEICESWNRIRELNPEISPELQEIIYRALERNPANRYASTREFAHDLRNPSLVGVAERPELRNWRKRRSSWGRRILFYVFLAMIPIVIFGLLLFFATHK